ncbi:sulfurtransferase complex subunit TusB [Marinobacter caseinilyticus]|uniref:sulfurtransferase complex subunit TusB n=1 Tax=Marinobacter caseinilyticus TaxID=2692195 RepID=UPI00140BD79A|nr:sulfurtransferase complex subunit TusB [Marinobacter caseinilyticus]
MYTLHLLNKSPDHPRFEACLAAVSADDVLVLTENAVLGLACVNETLPLKSYALESDVKARALQDAVAASGAKTIDSATLVALTETTHRIMSW